MIFPEHKHRATIPVFKTLNLTTQVCILVQCMFKKPHNIYMGLLVLKDSLTILTYKKIYKQCLPIYNYIKTCFCNLTACYKQGALPMHTSHTVVTVQLVCCSDYCLKYHPLVTGKRQTKL